MYTYQDSLFNFSEKPPTLIKYLLIAMLVIGLGTALINPLWHAMTTAPSPATLLSLSLEGLKNFYVWQLFTYPLLLSSFEGITFWSLVGFAFNLYLTYWLGMALATRLDSTGFLLLFSISGALSGLLATLTARLFGYSLILAGPSASLLSCFTLWCLLDPFQQIYVFFIRILAKNLLYIVLGAIALISLSQGDLVSIVLYGTAALTGYGVYWYLKEPHRLRFFERHTSEKIIPFPSYSIETESDEEFVDRMLEKISKFSEKSLSAHERKKLDKISKKNN